MSGEEDPAAWLRRVITVGLEHYRQVAGNGDAGERAARCEAELAILDLYAELMPFANVEEDSSAIGVIGRVVRLLAGGYRHREGYREEWKP